MRDEHWKIPSTKTYPAAGLSRPRKRPCTRQAALLARESTRSRRPHALFHLRYAIVDQRRSPKAPLTRLRLNDELIQIGPTSPLRARLSDAITMRRFPKDTQRNYLRIGRADDRVRMEEEGRN